jgi:hypothetical protein
VIKAVTDPCTVASPLQAISNAGILYSWDGTIDSAIGAATAAQYQAVQQWAELLFQTAAGSILRLTLVAPPLSILKADKKTVDPTNAGVVTLIAAAVGNLSDGQGNAAVSYVGGRLMPDRSDLDPIG